MSNEHRCNSYAVLTDEAGRPIADGEYIYRKRCTRALGHVENLHCWLETFDGHYRNPVLLTWTDSNADRPSKHLVLRNGTGCEGGDVSEDVVPTQRMWRAQVHVPVAGSLSDEFVMVRLPGWQNDNLFPVRRDALPLEIRDALKDDYRCYARVNIGAERDEDIRFENWEAPL